MFDKSDENQDVKNPLATEIEKDIANRKKWYDMDCKIVRRRLGERASKANKPYPNAPRPVVNIIDDVVTEKTEQEVSMHMNAPRLVNAIALAPGIPPEIRAKAEQAFDTFLRFICKARQKFDDGMDAKNCRGFAVYVVQRREDERWGLLPDFETVDPVDIIVPTDTKDLVDAERITRVLRFNPRKLREKEVKSAWKNVDLVIERCSGEEKGGDEKSSLRDREHLHGINTNPEDYDLIEVLECWHYATEWDVEQAKEFGIEKEVINDRRVCTIFARSAPDLVLNMFPWREDDQMKAEPLDENKAAEEMARAQVEMREPVLESEEIDYGSGTDKRWPFVQARNENILGRYFYAARGAGHRCMDDMMIATATLRAKMYAMDYHSVPMFERSGEYGDNSSNFTAEPGAILPLGLKPSNMQNIPSQLDFTVEYHKREAGRRMGAGSLYMFSGQMTETRKIEKTATESNNENSRLGMVSSASVDRHNDPLVDLYQMLWDDLVRLNRPLPVIENGTFQGLASTDVYQIPFLWVPASSAKTANPDLQYMKAKDVMSVAMGVAQMLPLDLQYIVKEVFSYYSPDFANKAFFDPNQQGPQGQPPIYMVLQKMQLALQNLATFVDNANQERDLKDAEKAAKPTPK